MAKKIADFKPGTFWLDGEDGQVGYGPYKVVRQTRNGRVTVIIVEWLTPRGARNTAFEYAVCKNDRPLTDAEVADVLLSGEYT